MSNTYTIAGVVVAGDIAHEYTERTYVVHGMSLDWTIIEQGNNVLKGMVKPYGLFKDAEFCQRCGEIYDGIQKKLIICNESRGLNIYGEPLQEKDKREDNIMRHTDFKGYLNDAKGIYEQSRVEYKNINNAWETAKKEWQRAQSSNLTDRDTFIAKGVYMQAEDDYKKGIKQLAEAAKQRLAEVRKEMKAHTDDFYRADPSKLDANTLKLLESGILSSSELSHLANQNRSNVTMLRMIRKYANEKLEADRKKGIHNDETVLLCHGIGALDGSEEMKVFDFLADRITRGLSTDTSWANANNMIFNEQFESYTGSFDGMFAQPGASAE